MIKYSGINGVPDFAAREFLDKSSAYCVLIPTLNEMGRLNLELQRALNAGVNNIVDIVICDGGSTDGCADEGLLRSLGANTLLLKEGGGKQGAQLRMGFWWAINRGYTGIITVDGNNKDSVEDVSLFVKKLEEGYDFVQGSRFIKDGVAINTPLIRYLAVRLIHAPLISFAARHHFTDTTNGFRAYSIRYLSSKLVAPFRDEFVSYELLAYLSVRASQLGFNVCEIPVSRAYPKGGKIPTKISPMRGNIELLSTLLKTVRGSYTPAESARESN